MTTDKDTAKDVDQYPAVDYHDYREPAKNDEGKTEHTGCETCGEPEDALVHAGVEDQRRIEAERAAAAAEPPNA